MDQLTMLWEYQLEDMKADKMANEIRRSPLRQKMENDRNLFMERQKQYKQIEEQVAVLIDRKDAIRDALNRAEDQLTGLQARFEQNPRRSWRPSAPLWRRSASAGRPSWATSRR